MTSDSNYRVVAHSSIDTLQGRMHDGKLSMIQMVGIPRSVSTAIGRALNESGLPSIFVNEPFNREIREPEQAAAQILSAADHLHGSHGKTNMVIVKNMASYLTPAAYEAMAELSDATVWNIRDPLVQIGSLVTRLVNDSLVGSGADQIKQEQLTRRMVEEACGMLMLSGRSQNFSKTGWESISAHWSSNIDGGHSAVVDGGVATADPARILAGVCGRIGLPFSMRMVDGWQQGYTNVINSDNEAETARSAWTSHAAKSVGIVAVSRTGLDPSLMPELMLQHVTDVAIPVYQAMMKSSTAVL